MAAMAVANEETEMAAVAEANEETEMVVLSEALLEGFGIVTRAGKGSALTHEEMDNNIRIGLDAMAFNALGTAPLEQYKGFRDAQTLDQNSLPMSFSPTDGIVVLKTMLINGLDISLSDGSVATQYLYDNLLPQVSKLQSGTYSLDISITPACKYLVIESSVDVLISVQQ